MRLITLLAFLATGCVHRAPRYADFGDPAPAHTPALRTPTHTIYTDPGF